ncbi:MAG: stage II sporulation protein R [Oscillospiraceae bacterium]|jgi:stage II sporulation protein R|nr:stage II sporulation protein R [Oscillospiraceae bacterium]
MKLKKWELALLMALTVTFVAGAALAREQRALSDKLIRLHVVANSDSEEDQSLKLAVRDRILAELTPRLAGVGTRGEALDRIGQELMYLTVSARDEVQLRGYSYPVSITLTREDFPTREYDTFSLPAGSYESLRVKIGAAEGRNWWCVVFPKLCVGEVGGDDVAALSDDEWALITERTGRKVVKFRCMELLSKFTKMFAV